MGGHLAGLEGHALRASILNGLWLPLVRVAAVLLAGGAIGYALSGALLPREAGRCERAGWGFAIALALLGGCLPFAFLLHCPPAAMIASLAVVVLAAVWLALRRRSESARPGGVLTWVNLLLLLLAIFGVAVYCLRALTEPMWSNDFLAIWGLKGKAIFATGSIPRRLFEDLALGFSHPEYPLGLPLLFAAVAFLLGSFDDHAIALLFPFLQVATLLALFGWLRRRGSSQALSLAAVALLTQFEPLYSAFHTGMADVPFSFAALLFGAALVDTLDGTDTFAPRRLAFASFLAVSTKNEGLLLVAGGLVVALLAARKARSASRRAFAALLVPAVSLILLGRLWKGPLPLRDFDLGYLNPSRLASLAHRIGETMHLAVTEVLPRAWPVLLCVVALVAAGTRTPRGDRLLLLVSFCSIAYLTAPALAVHGPSWLIQSSFARIVCALVPLAAAGIASRFRADRTPAE